MSGQFSTGAVVIDAGVVDQAVARALAQAGRGVMTLEKNAHFGIESPGLTVPLAVAEKVEGMLRDA
jgi:RAB protein geranylgeranyltransferase component A